MRERIVEFTSAYDKRNPKPSKNYGIHGVDIRFILKGNEGAVCFLIYTNWQLPHVRQEAEDKGWSQHRFDPMPADLGYHSLQPQHDDQLRTEECPYLDGKTCYYSGSALNANQVFDRLLREGGAGVWDALENYYNDIFRALKG